MSGINLRVGPAPKSLSWLGAGSLYLLVAFVALTWCVTGCDTGSGPTEPSAIEAAWTAKVAGKLAKFTNQTTGPAAFWRWDFGDLTTFSSEENPTHEYAKDGDYIVLLIACPISDFQDEDCGSASGVVTVDTVDVSASESSFESTTSSSSANSLLDWVN